VTEGQLANLQTMKGAAGVNIKIGSAQSGPRFLDWRCSDFTRLSSEFPPCPHEHLRGNGPSFDTRAYTVSV
jgi:hypothetical protein